MKTFKEYALNEKAHGMDFNDEALDELLKIHKLLGSKSSGKIYGWKVRKGGSVPGNMTEDGTLPSNSSEKAILRAESKKNHTFWIEATNGDAYVTHPDYPEEWFLIGQAEVKLVESNFKRNLIKEI